MSPIHNMVLTLILIYVSYLVITVVVHSRHAHNLAKALMSRSKFSILLLKLSAGILLFSIPVFFFRDVFLSQISFPEVGKLEISGIWLVLLMLVSGISLLSAIKEKAKGSFTMDPQIPSRFASGYLPLRFIFLFFYELFFRGFLLYAALQYTNLFYAIVINTILYVFIHFRDSRKEIIGSIPFGIILCLITNFSESIWPAVMLHIALAGFYESILLFYNPLKFRKI